MYTFMYVYGAINLEHIQKFTEEKSRRFAQLFYLWSANLSLLWPQNEMPGIHCIPYIYECRLNYWFVAQIQSLKYTRIWFNR